MGNRRRRAQESETSENHEETMEGTASTAAPTGGPALPSEATLRRKQIRLFRDLRKRQNEVLSLIESSRITASQISEISSEIDKASDELLEVIEEMTSKSSNGHEDDDMWEEYDAVQR